jgi:signal transduction histidine kinase
MVEDPHRVAPALDAPAHSRPSTAAAERQPFPTLGVLLVVAILALSITREVFAPEHGRARYAFVVLRSAEVLADVSFLAWLSRRLDARGLSPGRFVAAMLFINLVVSIAFAVAARGVMTMLGFEDARLTIYGAIGDGFFASLYIYALWTLGFRYPYAVRAAHARALEAERLREQAELVQLRAHLQPHFLRNTLNAVSALMTEDAREARRMLATLGDLLSDSIGTAGPRHTLDDEVAWLRRYAQILEARHHGALVFVWDVAPQVRGAPVPTMLLQPLVENAALHGALGRDGDGEVAVRARPRPGGGVEIVVEDNGPGFDRHTVRRGALGLHLVRRRLAIECPGSSFRIEPSPSGTRAIVELP